MYCLTDTKTTNEAFNALTTDSRMHGTDLTESQNSRHLFTNKRQMHALLFYTGSTMRYMYNMQRNSECRKVFVSHRKLVSLKPRLLAPGGCLGLVKS